MEDTNIRDLLVKENLKYYAPQFERYEEGAGSKWNWCAFLFSPCWFAFRKMYKLAGIAIAISLAIDILAAVMPSEMLNYIVLIVLSIAYVLFWGKHSNKLYWKEIRRKESKVPEGEAERAEYIKKEGGTSDVALIVAIAINVLIGVIEAFVGI